MTRLDDLRLTIRFSSAVQAPDVASAFQSDTIFGHLCWAVVRGLGEGTLKRFLGRFDEGDPPLVLSNGFPTGTLPRPLWLARPPRAVDKSEGLQAMAVSKHLGGQRLVTPADFETLTSGKLTGPPEDLPGSARSRQRSHNTVSRGGGVLEQGGYYATAETVVASVTVLARAQDGGGDALAIFARSLELEGYGKRRSAGNGSVGSATVATWAGFRDVDGADGFVSLSNFVPARADPVEGRWRLMVKRGKLGEERALDAVPFKRPVRFLEAGSCFRDHPVREWYGRMVRGVAPSRPDVVQYGLAYAVPMKLPEP